uniref:Uncharacterized protein n=1 Tax=Romanomermis culicivorax TaxID=13658 RepID=A0A915HX79_ROMCU
MTAERWSKITVIIERGAKESNIPAIMNALAGYSNTPTKKQNANFMIRGHHNGKIYGQCLARRSKADGYFQTKQMIPHHRQHGLLLARRTGGVPVVNATKVTTTQQTISEIVQTVKKIILPDFAS